MSKVSQKKTGDAIMRKNTDKQARKSRVRYEVLEEVARMKVQSGLHPLNETEG